MFNGAVGGFLMGMSIGILRFRNKKGRTDWSKVFFIGGILGAIAGITFVGYIHSL